MADVNNTSTLQFSGGGGSTSKSNNYRTEFSEYQYRYKGEAKSVNDDSDDIKKLIMASGIYDKFDMQWFTRFNRFGIIDPYNALLNTKEYIFITKPDLCLIPNIDKSNLLKDAYHRYYPVMEQLQTTNISSSTPFMTILSNTVTSSLDLPGISAESIETAGNVMGTRISYRGTSYKSDEDADFNLEFEDTKYLDVYMLFKIYDEYEKLKWKGSIDISQQPLWRSYITDKILHDQMSIYKIVVAEDGYRIVYWARITGCYPNSIPRDAFSDMTNTDTQKITVGWKGHFVRDMDPIILEHFNRLVGVNGNDVQPGDLPLFNLNTSSMDGTWAYKPYIYYQTITDAKHGRDKEYYLRWTTK